MKIIISGILLTLIFIKSHAQAYSIDEVFSKKFQSKLISRGDNFPDFRISKDSMYLFLVCLHNHIPESEFQKRMKFDNQRMDKIIQLLKQKNWLHEIDNQIKPSVFIATENDGKRLYKYAKPLSKDIAQAITQKLPEIKTRFMETDISKKQTFKEWSFMILSNVLLDNWQIFNVESEFLKATRPSRHGKNYYASITESSSDREAFGIYGNQVGEISVY